MPGDALRKAPDQIGPVGDSVASLPERTSDVLDTYPRARVGAPTRYRPDTARTVLSMIGNGHTPAEIGRMADMPSLAAIKDWAAKSPRFGIGYARARAKLPEAIVGQAFAEVWMPDLAPRDVARARLRWDCARWTAGKLDPARWGSKAAARLTIKLPDGEARQAMQRAAVIAALEQFAVAAPITQATDDELDK